MARKANRYLSEVTKGGNINAEGYRCGIYARLSSDKAEGKSESIENQIEMAKKWIAGSQDLVFVDVYSDYQKTGTNFNREGFIHMMEDIKSKRINCVIVKDLSRFGRNYITVGDYIQNVFPFLGVRFISLNDHLDTMDKSIGDKDLELTFKNLVNEIYAKNISEKVKAAVQIKIDAGSYLGGAAPYGYRIKQNGEIRMLEIYEGTAAIVNQIFDWYLNNWSIRKIAMTLQEKEVVPPKQYSKIGKVYYCKDDVRIPWSFNGVGKILQNEVYLGKLIQCKSLEKREKLVFENTHEGIIPESVFTSAQELRRKRNTFSKYSSKTREPMYKEMYCGCCHKRLYPKMNQGMYYYCKRMTTDIHQTCEVTSISESTLNKVVFESVSRWIQLSDVKLKELHERFCTQNDNQRHRLIQKQAWIQGEIKKLESSNVLIYEDYILGKLSQEEIKQLRVRNQSKKNVLLKDELELQAEIVKSENLAKKQQRIANALLQLKNSQVITEDFIAAVIDRVYLYADKRLEIVYQCSDILGCECEVKG